MRRTATHTTRRLALIATIITLAAVLAAAPATPATAQPLPGQIVVHPSYPQWLAYEDGSPFFLCGPGDPEGFLYRGSLNPDGTRAGDQLDLIDKLDGTGANSIYMQVIRSHGGDGESTHNPFVDHDPGQGLNQLVLDQWETWFTAMDAAGIVIFLFVYDDSASVWNTGDQVGAEEGVFLAALVDRFEHHAHLIWVVAEEYQEAFSNARAAAIAAAIRAADDHDHPIAVHQLGGIQFDFTDDPNIDQFAIQYGGSASDLHAGMVQAWGLAGGRYNLNMSEAASYGTGETARRKSWAVALGGAYVMQFEMDIDGTAVSDLEDCGRLREFFEASDFAAMAPHDELAHGDTDYVLADPGSGYLVYADSLASDMGVQQLPAGDWEMEFFDAVTGSWHVVSEPAWPGGDWAGTPPFSGEVAVWIHPAGEPGDDDSGDDDGADDDGGDDDGDDDDGDDDDGGDDDGGDDDGGDDDGEGGGTGDCSCTLAGGHGAAAAWPGLALLLLMALRRRVRA